MAFYGSVYRDRIKDFDFIVDSERLGAEIIHNIKDELTYNKIIGKDRVQLETYLKNIFPNTTLGKEMFEIFGEELNLISCMIDRVSQYDFQAKATFIFKWKNIEFDLLFRDNINYNIYEYAPNKYIKLQYIKDILNTKKLLGRPKDFQDLINYKPYKEYESN